MPNIMYYRIKSPIFPPSLVDEQNKFVDIYFFAISETTHICVNLLLFGKFTLKSYFIILSYINTFMTITETVV